MNFLFVLYYGYWFYYFIYSLVLGLVISDKEKNWWILKDVDVDIILFLNLRELFYDILWISVFFLSKDF